MQLRYIKTSLPPVEGICKVTAIAWSPNSRRMAVVTMDRIVHLFDENGERRDKFSTKPADSQVRHGLSYSKTHKRKKLRHCQQEVQHSCCYYLASWSCFTAMTSTSQLNSPSCTLTNMSQLPLLLSQRCLQSCLLFLPLLLS